MRILIVEDDEVQRRSLANHLTESGFTVEQAGTASEGAYFAEEFATALAVIDLGLPDGSGQALVEKLRADGADFPILILTARDHWEDKVKGLNAGADDYVVKPYNVDELSARINALLRRAAGSSRPVLQAGPLSLDTLSRHVSLGGESIELTDFEYRILEILIARRGDVVSRSHLVDQLYQQDYDRDSNVIDVMINRLRKKFGQQAQLIETVRGAGYRMRSS